MKRITIVLAIIAFVVIGWAIAWSFAANEIRQQAATLAPNGSASSGITCERLDIAGFPFRFDVTCTNAIANDGDITISVPEIKLTALVYRPTHLLAFAAGPLRYEDAFFATSQEIRWESLEASLRLSGWSLARFSAEATNISYIDTLLGETQLAELESAEFHLLDMPDKKEPSRRLATLGLFTSVNNVQLPLYEIDQGNALIEAELTGIPDDVRNWPQSGFLRNWQRSGGAIRVMRADASDAMSNAALTGELRLNENGEAEGQVIIETQGVTERLDGLLEPGTQSLVFGNRREDGSHRQVITVARGALLAGMAPLVTLPPAF